MKPWYSLTIINQTNHNYLQTITINYNTQVYLNHIVNEYFIKPQIYIKFLKSNYDIIIILVRKFLD